MNALRRFFGALAVLGCTLFCATPAAAYTTEMLYQGGPSANRIDLVIMGDGYRAQDQAKMTTDAQKVLNAFFADKFWSTYKNYLNVKLVHVVSNQDGADNGMYGSGVMRDTALGAYFNCANIDRLLCVNAGTVNTVAFNDAPEYDQILVIVNDTKYGGAGGSYATTSMDPGAVDVPIHEVGHSLFGLADEYEYGGESYARCDAVNDCSAPNVTVKNTLATIKWNAWIEAGTPIPTPETAQYASTVGLFEGAAYYPTGQYRPWQDCLMRSLGQSLCPVCTEAAVLKTYDFASLEDSHLPNAASVSMTTTQTVTFGVTGPRPIPNTVSAKWYKNNGLLAGFSQDSADVSGATLGVGTHQLRVDLSDDTTLVREDPSNKLFENRTWTVTVTDGGGGTGGAGSGGAGSGGTSSGGASSGGASSGGASSGGSAGTGGTGGGNCPPAWVNGGTYTEGQSVSIGGYSYTARWWTQSNPETDNGANGSGKAWTQPVACGGGGTGGASSGGAGSGGAASGGASSGGAGSGGAASGGAGSGGTSSGGAGSGGDSGTGGVSSGGTAGTGGDASGGSAGTGGDASGGTSAGGTTSGGTTGAGGVTSTGGDTSSGGSNSGGAAATGGITASGGVTATGGVVASGGVSEDQSSAGAPASDDGGCSCSTTKQSSTNVPAILGLGLAALAVHRRRRSAHPSFAS